ncbi:hypothetical protein BDF20DRAFT_574675 [Mycotypha africana]|uniref:uncharacterized protein n=1 Tax=Mycotypha africana TaxID=64632 RepID=UPI0022FFC87D|nr:uncharacterized protein BDF20DRAFT_574675 [Mycotypha africana]KAI8977568.1 hypothetical protein BDF20DRAFT_574675 [Mycotypha africana]
MNNNLTPSSPAMMTNMTLQQTPLLQQAMMQQQQQQQQQQQSPQVQQLLENNHPNNVNEVNWRDEVTVADRGRFVSQLSMALKHLSPNTNDNETYNIASSFENGLYQRCQSKKESLNFVKTHTYFTYSLFFFSSFIPIPSRINTSWLTLKSFSKSRKRSLR